MNCETEIVHRVCVCAVVVVVAVVTAVAAIVYSVGIFAQLIWRFLFSISASFAVSSTHVSFDCLSRVHRALPLLLLDMNLIENTSSPRCVCVLSIFGAHGHTGDFDGLATAFINIFDYMKY